MSSNSQLALKSVAEIAKNNLKFFIPDYQRGYRWEKEQVEDLLNDLVEFFQSGKPLYCLQPLVVVKREADEWEVVDGQQRLTTLFLVLSHLPGKHPGFEIRYQRHKEHFDGLSQKRWEKLRRNDLDDRKIPDLHYIGTAANQIKEFLEKNPEQCSLLQKLTDTSKPPASFIWYQLPKEDSIAAFTRLNAGKIPLTDVELIRALFLRSDSEQTEPERLRIATAWDQMEKRLNDDEFWSFAAPADYNPVNRIELVFQMVTGRLLDQQDHELFHHFEKRILNQRARETWEELERAFSALEEWHDDHALFHLIGYLSNTAEAKHTAVWILYCGYWRSSHVTTKDSFRKALKGIIKNRLVGNQDIQSYLNNLKYGKSDIRKPLLCFNLATLMNERHGTVRFSFHAFQSQGWDVEHIHSQAPKDLTGKELDDFLNMYRNHFKRIKTQDDLLNEIECAIGSQADESERSALYQKCLEWEKVEELDEDALHSMANLALLDSETNRGYKNASYKVKRAWILDPDRQHIYIPPCTRSVFTKSYTAEADELLRWNLGHEQDGDSYVLAMANALTSFFKEAECIVPSPVSPDPNGKGCGKVASKGSDQKFTKEPSGTAMSFLELLKAHRIVIPLIQRDYAQGRESQLTIRTDFLNSIFRTLEEGEYLNLDFVYGTAEGGISFQPIDGQQRLTTLFLLHWFVFWQMGNLEKFQKLVFEEDETPKFQYRVRPGAERFFPAFLKWKPNSNLPGDKWFQEELPEQIWFSRSWRSDPTVRGSLVMLDAIREKFRAVFEGPCPDDLEARLGNIKMEVLVLPESISADEIYLKMNARGKALTDFEKFKAWLIKNHSSPDVGYDCNLRPDQDWKLQLDQDWLQFFWGKSEDKKDRATTVSACFFNTVLALAINAQAGRESRSGESGEKQKAKAFNDQISNWIHLDRAYRVNEWEKLFDTTTVDWVFNSLDEFHNRMDEVDSLMKSGDWISKKDLVFSEPDLKLSAPDRCWFHAITLFCQGKCRNDREWFRVARNLISNTDIADIPDTIRSLNKLAEGMNSGVHQRLASMEDGEAACFMPKSFREQLEEERTKAKLLSVGNSEWEVIRTVENHPFLKGQIGILLRGSENEEITVDAGVFLERWKTFKLLMDRDAMNPLIAGTDDERLDRLVIRAVLARCNTISKNGIILLPYMSESSWGKELKRNHAIKSFQDGLLSVIDEINGKTEVDSNAEILAEELTHIASSTQHSQETWIKTLIEHGDMILGHSESWKIRNYHWWSQNETALFVYYKYNTNAEDVLIGQEFEIRNQLISLLVAQKWELSGASRIGSTDKGIEIFTGHQPELRRDGRKLVFFYQSIELDEIGEKKRILFMNDVHPRKIQDVLGELKENGMTV